ncbi:protein phosphatase CheZ [Chenggangzhangella methanolivorans]|uniref:Protein phosphatase CheZ n=1 Tax=Chenggangzhangella methanolivorans TaxID=1437009 RepID=A0A9E6RCZ2_9HYPH|nr:protein phosphatase CheZ [Chenggangzhangella methanolivorans]QZO01545.1 protein phosphatase CheZ [Chenggangzhangella methanolivorans]
MASAARKDALEQPFERVRDYVGAKAGGEATFGDVVALAEITAESMQAFFATIDRSIYRELREISDYILNMRTEIAHLRAGELRSDRLPKAGEDLGAIVLATEEATNSIMEAAEAMMAATSEDEATMRAVVNDKVMAIFEACSFQDLTGQRIARVIATLEHIEERIGRFASAVRTDAEPSGVETAQEKRARELLLHGPQDKGVAIDQDDVDALFS